MKFLPKPTVALFALFYIFTMCITSCSKDEKIIEIRDTVKVEVKDTVEVKIRDTIDLELPDIIVTEQYNISMTENPQVGSIVATIEATSESILEYEFLGNSGGFLIDPASGTITVDNYKYPQFDYETDTTLGSRGYLLVVQVSSEERIKTVEVQVNLADTTILWTGPDLTFTKSDSADWTQEGNQDRITDNVWLTRAHNKGLFNIAIEEEAEGECNSTTPSNTLWANNLTGETSLTTESIANMDFDLFVEYSFCYPLGRINQPSILMIPEQDIFMNITITQWTSGAKGGGFSYTRSTPSEN